MCKCMQVYCEPFFVAVNRWRTCGSEEIMRNRLALCETAFEIMNEYSQAQQNMEFDVACEEEAELEAEVMPSAGKDYIFGGDRVAYEAARKLIPEDLFNRVGIFFQQNLLKGMAGNGDSYLATCNDFNRKSIIAAIEKLFRIPTKAGKAHFVKRIVDDKTGGAKFKIHATVKISTNGQTFGDILLDSVKQERVQATTKKEKERSATVGKKRKESASTSGASSSSAATGTSSASKAKKPRTQKDNDEDDAGNDSWTTDHHSIGTQVANYFSLPGGRKLFRGEVVKYAPPSRPRARDQLYHIRWEDGDEEDYDESQLQSAVGLFARHFAAASSPVAPSSSSSPPASRRSGTRAPRTPRTPTVEVVELDEADEDEAEWSTTHPSVGTQVAAVFKVKRKSVIYRGRVTRYCPPSSSTEHDQLYHVRWEDSDSEDYDEDELQAGIALFEKEFGAQTGAGAASSSSSSAAAVITISSDSSVASPGASGGPSAMHVDYDTTEWTTEHPAVGSPVALFFPPSGRHKKLFRGIVTKFAPETAPNARDQLYHVDFEDGDACDLEEDGFHQGIALYQLHCNGNNVSTIVLSSSVVSADEPPVGAAVAEAAVTAQPPSGEAVAALEAVVNAIAEAQASSALDDAPAAVATAEASASEPEAATAPSHVSAELVSPPIAAATEEQPVKTASSSDAEGAAPASETAAVTEGVAETA